jgi:hypothetical protein
MSENLEYYINRIDYIYNLPLDIIEFNRKSSMFLINEIIPRKKS